jgi:hypothetical protein
MIHPSLQVDYLILIVAVNFYILRNIFKVRGEIKQIDKAMVLLRRVQAIEYKNISAYNQIFEIMSLLEGAPSNFALDIAREKIELLERQSA